MTDPSPSRPLYDALDAGLIFPPEPNYYDESATSANFDQALRDAGWPGPDVAGTSENEQEG